MMACCVGVRAKDVPDIAGASVSAPQSQARGTSVPDEGTPASTAGVVNADRSCGCRPTKEHTEDSAKQEVEVAPDVMVDTMYTMPQRNQPLMELIERQSHSGDHEA